MSDRRHQTGWRATAFAVALFAITLNFLQPLAHAALMRGGGPSTAWGIFCNAGPDTREQAPGPLTADKHDCCLGLAHAAVFPVPTAAAVAVVLPEATVPVLQPIEVATSVGIRDGPHRPRGPPSLA